MKNIQCELSRGYDFVLVAFSDDGRAAFATSCSTKKEMEEWKANNKEYTWAFYKAERGCLIRMNDQLRFF